MEAPRGAAPPEKIKELPKLEAPAPITLSLHELVEEPRSSPAEEGGMPASASGLLQVVERRQPLSSVSSLEVHFDLLDLTELTDMSDQELAEVFADSDEENVASEPPSGPPPHPHVAPRAGYLRSPSWTRLRVEPPEREKQQLSEDLSSGRRVADPLPVAEESKED